MKAVQIRSHGGTEVMKYETGVPVPLVKENEVLVRNHIAGLNFIDTYHRTGLYKVEFPFILGREGAGIVEKIGSKVTEFRVGDRVAYGPTCSGSYATFASAPIENVVKLPSNVSFEIGTASIISGLTAHYLVKGSYYVKKGDIVLIHAISGALGQILLQMCKHLGAFVIGTTSTAEKAQIAKRLGCDEVILYTEQDFVSEVKRITNGKGCNVVYDSVGKTTFLKSLDCLARRGFMISCGNASGAPPDINPLLLSQKGSLTLNRPSLKDYIATREEFLERVHEVFKWINEGALKITIGKIFSLDQAAEAHRELEARNTVGKVLLKVE